MPQKIDSFDGKLDLGEEERPDETAAVENHGQLPLSPARNVEAVVPGEARAHLLAVRLVGKNGVTGSCVHKKTLLGDVIHNEDELARGDGIDPPPAT